MEFSHIEALHCIINFCFEFIIFKIAKTVKVHVILSAKHGCLAGKLC